MKKITVILLLGIHQLIQAQGLGPVNPCVDCENFTKSALPVSGIWYNPQQPGTGFSFDVQNGKVFGAYYGYDEQGQQVWLTFLGDLVASDEIGVMWSFDSELKKFENGTSFNSTYQENQRADYQGNIHFNFSTKNHAVFSVNGGESQNIVPLIFAVPKSVDFPEQTTYEFPYLAGQWSFVYYFKNDRLPQILTTASQLLVIDLKHHRDIDGDGIEDINYIVTIYYPDNAIIGEINCMSKENNGAISGPSCEFVDFRLSGDPFNPTTYKMPVGGLGVKNIFAEAEDGSTIEAFRVNYNNYVQNPFKNTLVNDFRLKIINKN